MRADHPDIEGTPAGVPHTRHRRAVARLLMLMLALGSLLFGMGAVMAGSAFANSYNGLLSSSANVNVPALIGGVPAGSVYDQLSWSAPGGVQFHGFAYTAVPFGCRTSTRPVGSQRASGIRRQRTHRSQLSWTTDCSISEDDSPRTWINSGVSVSSSTRAPTRNQRLLRHDQRQYERLELHQRRGRVDQSCRQPADRLPDADAFGLVCARFVVQQRRQRCRVGDEPLR